MDEIVAAIKVTSCFRWLIAFPVLYTRHGPWAFHDYRVSRARKTSTADRVKSIYVACSKIG